MRESEPDREDIYHKLALLAKLAEHMGSQVHYFEYETKDFFGLYLLLMSIAQEIYPESKQKKE